MKTPKQKLRSIKMKMKRLQDKNYNIDLEYMSNNFHDIEKYYKLQLELFILEYENSKTNRKRV